MNGPSRPGRAAAPAASAAPVLLVLPAVIALIALVALLATAPPAAACGPFAVDALFWPPHASGVPADRLAAGRLGTLGADHDATELFVAYRHLAGPPLTTADRRALADLLTPQPPGRPQRDATEAWQRARQRVPGVEPVGWISTHRRVERQRGDGVSFDYVHNCLPDAFRTAAATLEARIAVHGAASREVAAWLQGQDQVFANCGGGRHVPAPLADTPFADLPPTLHRDRTYQRAAAHFYATDYATAARLFAAIAADPDSRWRRISRYLVARTRARDGDPRGAVELLRRILADPDMEPLHASARGLIDHYRMRYEPAEVHREARRRLLGSPLPATLRQDWTDFLWSLSNPLRAEDAEHDLDLFLAAVGRWTAPSPPPSGHALERWRATGSRLWRTAALATAGAATPDADREALLAATMGVPASAPEHATVAYHRARLLLALGRPEEARRTAGALLATLGTGAPPALRNRVRALRAETAPDLTAFLADSQLPAVGDWSPDLGPRSVHLRPGMPVLLTDRATAVLNSLTTAELVGLAAGGTLDAGPRRRLALAAWTRAAVLGDRATARALTPVVAHLEPALAPGMAAYAGAAAGDAAGEAEFVAALVLLRHPGLHPDLHPGLDRPGALDEIDNFRRNWWCEGEELFLTDLRTPAFLPPEPRRARQRAALEGIAAGPDHLGRIVLAHAERHPRDPRLPEALHRVVRATRFGCPRRGGRSYGPTSRDAFRHLHHHFPDSPWTAKTPYWFE